MRVSFANPLFAPQGQKEGTRSISCCIYKNQQCILCEAKLRILLARPCWYFSKETSTYLFSYPFFWDTKHQTKETCGVPSYALVFEGMKRKAHRANCFARENKNLCFCQLKKGLTFYNQNFNFQNLGPVVLVFFLHYFREIAFSPI